MKELRTISPEEMENVFRLIGKDWMLITAKGKDHSGKDTVNAMTASWGGMGVLWNKPVAFCFIRPQRYTYELTEQSSRLSLSFLPEAYRPALRLCGTKSGRDMDKFAAAGLTPVEADDGTPYVKEARLVLLCRKLYADDLREAAFIDRSLLSNYSNDFHRVYVVEIEKAMIEE